MAAIVEDVVSVDDIVIMLLGMVSSQRNALSSGCMVERF